MAAISILNIASDVPPNKIDSDTMLDSVSDRISDQTLKMFQSMDIDSRYSVLDKYEKYICGERPRKLISGVNELAANSVIKCVEKTTTKLDIGLFISITNTASRPLPCTAYEVISKLGSDVFPHDVNIINMQNQGCSALVKALEVASYYLSANPDKQVMINVAEAHTAMFEPAFCNKEAKVVSFPELKCITNQESQNEAFMKLNNAINSYLFGDGAISILVGAGNNESEFTSHHLTNLNSEDTELLHMDEGGSEHPFHLGFPHYMLGKQVGEKGALYSKLLFDKVNNSNIDYYLVHTGSKKIINSVQHELGLDDNLNKIRMSYDVLKYYGNTSSCSIGFMLDNLINKTDYHGKTLIISFGVGFSASIAKFDI